MTFRPTNWAEREWRLSQVVRPCGLKSALLSWFMAAMCFDQTVAAIQESRVEKLKDLFHAPAMNISGLAAATLIAVVLSAGCDSATAPKPAPSSSFHNSPNLDHAMPKLPTIKLWVGAQELETEIAITLTQVATGMMFRDKMAENEAMLFVFAEPQPRQFYMKNCVVPLSAAYIDSDGAILEVVPLQPGVEEPVPSKSDQVQFVLETPQGWFERHKVPIGSVIRTERGTLRETFAGKATLP